MLALLTMMVPVVASKHQVKPALCLRVNHPKVLEEARQKVAKRLKVAESV